MKNRISVFIHAAVSVFLALFVLCAAGCSREDVYFRLENMSETADAGSFTAEGPEEAEEPQETPETAEPGSIWVYVCGAVYCPGVYELPEGSRVYEALAAAGGLTEEAEERSLNQASLLTDGQQILVYTEEEIQNMGGAAGTAGDASGSGRVNLNTAGMEELMTLSGIGESRAQAILMYREQYGPFTSIEEIMNIDGIKEKSFAKIKEYIEV